MLYLDERCTYRESYDNNEHTYTFTGPCIVTGKPYSVTVKGSELFALRQGKHIQNALVSNSSSDREFLLTGVSPEG